MDPALGEWLFKAIAGAVIGGLGFTIRGLFTRVRILESALTAIRERPMPSGEAGTKAREELQLFKLCVAENYIRRDDYVTQMAGVITKLDSIGVMVARLDERRRMQEALHES